MSHETDRQGHVVGRVAGLRAFPVKSMTAPRLEHARVETSGLQHDRVWAVVDDEGAVVTAKQVGGLRDVAAVVPEGEHAPELVLAGDDEPLTEVRSLVALQTRLRILSLRRDHRPKVGPPHGAFHYRLITPEP